MTHHREDVVIHALDVLDRYGLADLSMRRLATELQVRPSAIYHHFAGKQHLLAALADELLERGRRGRRTGAWRADATEICAELRDAMLAYRDGADLVATVHAFGLGAARPGRELSEALSSSGLDAEGIRVATRTLLHFVFGHTAEEQANLQAASVGAISDEVRPDSDSDFAFGLGLVLDGIEQRAGAGVRWIRATR